MALAAVLGNNASKKGGTSMGWFDLLRGKPAAEAFIDGSFLHIPSLGYFGWYATSLNRRYIITWRDGNDGGTASGARSEGIGRFYLLHDNRVVAEGISERPNDGKIADNGTFIVNDWLFSGDLSGTFRAFTGGGHAILERRFNANLLNNGLSDDGRVAVCQTCNAPNGDGSLLTVFDLDLGRELSRFIPECGWAQDYAFISGHVVLCYADGGRFAYTLDGTFTDRERWISWSLEHGNLSVVENQLQSVRNNLGFAEAVRLIAATDVALARERIHDHTKAWALKLRGRCCEAVGNNGEALRCYEEALALEPKIGAKRLAAAARKRIGDG